MLTYWETLIARKSNITVSDSYAALWGKKFQSGYTVETYSGTLPTTLTGTKAGYLYEYSVYGNTEQIGTPTPENPIMPSGCGVRTENLFAANNASATVGAVTISNDNGKITVTGRASSEISSVNAAWKNAFTFRLKAGAYYFAGSFSGGVSSYLRNANDDARISLPNDSFVLSNDTDVYIGFWVYNNNIMTFNVMLNTGSTPLPYEPYGYKLPIAVNGVEYPIYLGESQSTRRVKKLVLTGDENVAESGTNYNLSSVASQLPISRTALTCTHFTVATATLTVGKCRFGGSSSSPNSTLIVNYDNGAGGANTFKTYLTQQYANGTPVTVWYVLAEPEIAVVNEPLMKIGDYADTIDSTQSAVQIPTAAGETTISWAGEGLAPSEVEFVYKVKR